MESKRQVRRPILGWIITTVVVGSIVMSVGPGVLLVNRPTILFGLPLVYLWAIGWYLVLCVAAIISYRYLWADTSKAKETDNHQA